MQKTKKFRSIIVTEQHDQDGYPVYKRGLEEKNYREITPAEALPLLNTSSCTIIDARSLFEKRDWFGVIKLHVCYEAYEVDGQVVQIPDGTPGREP